MRLSFRPIALASLLLVLAGTSLSTVAEPAGMAARPHEHLTHRLLADIEAGVARVTPWLDRYGYWAVFGAVGVEGFGVPAPGQTLLEAAAAEAGRTGGRLRIGWVVLAGFLGAALGSSVGWLIGRAGGRELLTRLHVPTRHLARVDAAFARYGGLVVLFARFFDGPRQLAGIAAGVLGMPWWRFTAFNLVGAALWTALWALGVYYLDLHLDQLVTWLRLLNPWVAGATLAGLALLVLGLLVIWRRRRRSETGG